MGIDLGAGRGWSAAVAMWESGRVEAIAVAPGVPSVEDQEKRDVVPRGTYSDLENQGILDIADGLRVPPPGLLWQAIQERWGIPVGIVCDRFRLGELYDAVGDVCVLEPRVTRWKDAASDVRSLRKLVRDGPMSIAEGSRPLLIASLSVAYVKSDDQGGVRLAKRSKDNRARDDVAAALLLVAGAWERAQPARSVDMDDESDDGIFMA